MSNNYFLKPNNFYIEEEYNFGKYFLNLNKNRSNLHILIPISNNFFPLSFIYGKSGLLNPIRNNFTFSIYYKIVYDEVSNNYTIYDYLGNDYLYEFDNSKSVYISKDNGTVLRFDSIYNEIYVYYPDQSHMLFKFDPSTDNEQIIIPNYMENKEKERITFSSYTLNSVNYIEISGTKNQKILIKKNNNATLSYSIEVVNTLINTIIRKYSFYEMSSSIYIFREDVLGSDHLSFVTHNQVQFSISNNLSITSSKDNTTLTFTYNTQNGYYTNVTNSYTNNSYIISYNVTNRYTSVTSNSNGVSKTCYYGYDNQNAPLYFIDYRGNIKNFTYENNKLLTSYPIINLNDGDNLLTNGDFNSDLENWDINGTVNINDSIASNKKLPKSLSKFVSITSNSNISQTIDVNGDLYTSIYLYLECYSTLTSQFRVTLSFYRDDLLIKGYIKIYSSKNYVQPVNDCFECGGSYFNKIIISITGLNTVIAANIGNIKLIKTVDVVKNKYNDKYGLIYESKTLGKNIQEISYGVDENIKISSSRNNRKFSTYSTSDNYIETSSNGNKQRVFYNRDDELNIISKTIRKSFNNIYLYKEETYLHNMLINVEDEQKIDHEYLYDGYHFYLNEYTISNNSSDNYSVIYNLNDYLNISSQSINGNNVDYVYDVNGANQKLNDISSSELKYTFTYSSNDLPSIVFFKDSNNTSSMVISYTYLSGNFKSDVILSKVYSGSNQIMFAYDSYYEYITTISNTEKTLYSFTYSNSLLTSETNFCGSSINRYYYEYENAYLVEERDETYKINYIYDGRYQLVFTNDNNLINSSFSTTLDYSYDKEYISNLLESSGFGLVNNLSSTNSSFSGTKEGLIIKYPLINNPNINRTNDSGLTCFTPSVNGVAPVYRIYEKDVLELPSCQEITFLIKPNSLNQIQYLFTLIFNHDILAHRLSLYINEENKFVLAHSSGTQINSTPINSNLLVNKWNLVRFRYNHEINEYRISINYSQFVTFDNIGAFVIPSYLLNIDLVLGSNISYDLTNYNSHFNGKIAIPMISHPNTFFDDDAYNLYDKYIETKTSNNSYFSNELSDNAFNKSYYLDNLSTNNFPLNGSFKSLDDKTFDEQKTIKGVNDFVFNEDVSAFMYELGVNKYLRKNNCVSFDKGIVTLLIKPLNKSILSRSNVILHFKNGDYGYYFLIDESNKLYFNTTQTIDSSRFLNITLQSNCTKRLTINYFRTGSNSLTFNVKYGEVSQTTTINNINFVTGSMDLVLGCYYKNYSASCLIGSLSYNNVNMDINSFISGLDKNIHTSIITDKFNRLSLEKISCNNDSLITKVYSYKAIPQEGDVQIIGVTRTSNVLQNETINVGSTSISYDYTFDYLGRVTSISSNGNTLSRYLYNSKGFISRKWSGDILSDFYSYDSKGNITSYTHLGSNAVQMTYDEKNRILTYNQSNVKNLSFAYNPTETYQLKTITDSISGNVINLSYIGNRLSSYIVSNGNHILNIIQFIYNSKGERIYKIVNTNPIKYRYQNGCLVESISSNSVVRYLYDSSNNAIGFIYNSNKYFYIRDALKCIKKIIDETGNTVVTYNYSPFGKIISIQDNSGINLGNINQIVYKGYVYDVETGLFLMGHRYYSPELCRFIQLDDIEYIDPSSINGLNLYSYANNNPISIHYNTTLASTGIVGSGMVSSIGSSVGGGAKSGSGGGGSSSPSRNLPSVPGWLETVSTAINHSFSIINPIRTAGYIAKYPNLWNLMRIDGVTELPGTLSKVATGVGWGLGIIGGVIAGYEKYASGASGISSIFGGLINAGISVGGMYAATGLASLGMGVMAAASIPGGIVVVGGAVIAILAGIGINYLLTEVDFFGNTIEGYINDFIDWLIFWD